MKSDLPNPSPRPRPPVLVPPVSMDRDPAMTVRLDDGLRRGAKWHSIKLIQLLLASGSLEIVGYDRHGLKVTVTLDAAALVKAFEAAGGAR